MKKIRYIGRQLFCATLLLFISVSAFAAPEASDDEALVRSVTTTAGSQLDDKLSELGITPSSEPSLQSLQKLTVSGPINSDDIEFIHEFLYNLTELDLSAARIVGGGSGYHKWKTDSKTGIPARDGETTYVTSEDDIIQDYMFYGIKKLVTLRLPDTATRIGKYGVAECTALTNLTLPAALTTLDDYAIAYPSASAYNSASLRGNLRQLTLPSTLTTIGKYAFSYSRLESVVIPEGVTSMGTHAFYSCINLSSIQLPDALSEIPDYCFNECTALQNVNLPAKLTRIGSHAFYKCAMGSIALPSGVKEIATYAFSNCSGLTSVQFNEGLTTIGTYAFQSCKLLANFTLPSTLTSLGESAFYNCDALTSISFPNSVTILPKSVCQSCDALETVTLPSGLTAMRDYVFSQCANLTTVNIDDVASTLTSIGAMAFYDTGVNVMLPAGLTYLGNQVFGKCKNLTTFVLPEGIKVVPNNTCDGCTALTSVTLHDGVTGIGSSAFSGCNLVEEVQLPSSLLEISSGAFQKCTKLGNVTFPAGLLRIQNSAFSECTSLTEAILPSSLTLLGGSTFYKCTGLTKAVVNGAATSLGNSAFQSCSNLTDVTLAEGITELSYQLFKDCTKLPSQSLPSTITKIGQNVFENCKALTTINLPEGLDQIGSDAFRECASLQSITFPSTLTTIGGTAFYNCLALTRITLPHSVTSLGGSAFSGCTALEYASLSKNINYASNSQFSYFYNCKNLKVLRIYAAAVPPISASYVPYRTTCELQVPEGTKTLYEAANTWKEFMSITEFGSDELLNEHDFAVLQALYNALDGENWTHKWDLSSRTRFNDKWYGVTLDGDFIKSINLEDNGLKGTLTPDVFTLNWLTRLNLSHNELEGDMGSLLAEDFENTRLKTLNLCDNKLSGDLAPFANKFPNIENLRIDFNRLTDISVPLTPARLQGKSQYLNYDCQFVDYKTLEPVEDANRITYDIYIGKLCRVKLTRLHTRLTPIETEPILTPHYLGNVRKSMSMSSNSISYDKDVLKSDGNGGYVLNPNSEFHGKRGAVNMFLLKSGLTGSNYFSIAGKIPVFVQLDWTVGDVNGDLNVDALDLSEVIYYALHDTKTTGSTAYFNYSCADENEDEVIDVYDCVTNVNRILEAEPSDDAPVKALRRIHSLSETGEAEQMLWISTDGDLSLRSDVAAASAMNLTLSGARAGSLRLNPRYAGVFTMAARQVGGETRVVLYSLSGATLPEGVHSLIYGIDPAAQITSVTVADSEAKEVKVCVGEGDIPNAMQQILAETQDTHETYDLQGRTGGQNRRGVNITKQGHKYISK